jgi:hypothetical protein
MCAVEASSLDNNVAKGGPSCHYHVLGGMLTIAVGGNMFLNIKGWKSEVLMLTEFLQSTPSVDTRLSDNQRLTLPHHNMEVPQKHWGIFHCDNGIAAM